MPAKSDGDFRESATAGADGATGGAALATAREPPAGASAYAPATTEANATRPSRRPGFGRITPPPSGERERAAARARAGQWQRIPRWPRPRWLSLFPAPPTRQEPRGFL